MGAQASDQRNDKVGRRQLNAVAAAAAAAASDCHVSQQPNLSPGPLLTCRVGIIGAGANTKTRHIPNLQASACRALARPESKRHMGCTLARTLVWRPDSAEMPR